MEKLSVSEKSTLSLLLSKGPLSRKEIAKALGLTGAAVTLICAHLLQQKLIVETGEKESKKAGRKELLLSLSGSTSFLGLDIKKHSFTVSVAPLHFKEVKTWRYEKLEEALTKLKSIDPALVLGCGILARGKADKNSIQEKYPSLISFMAEASFPCFISNNVNCLASIYHLLHREKRNFLLVKYGPGVGSSIYANGASLSFGEEGESELGHILLENGKTLEENISFETLLSKEVDEVNGVEELKRSPNLPKALSLLAKSVLNADRLLSFDSIVVSGLLLGENETLEVWKKEFKKIDAAYPVEKITPFENYADIDAKKCCYSAFYHLFCS